jgi:tetratricopeptide (TPR) repeat protein
LEGQIVRIALAKHLSAAVALVCGATTLAIGDTFTGSGVVIGSRGEILTNSHVVEGCESILVQVPSESPEKAVLIARDERNDLAVIRTNKTLKAIATFREGSPPRAGDGVIVLGYPLSGLLAATANLTVGNVSALAGLGNDSRYLQISAPVQPGNSGGPLLDGSGHLIGIVTFKLNAANVARATGDIPQNVNFAIKAAVARTFLDSQGIAYRVEATPVRGFWDFGRHAKSGEQLSPADVGAIAKPFTVYIECEQAPPLLAASAAAAPAPEPRAPRPLAPDDEQVCKQQTGDDAIAACTHIIASRNKESATLALALGRRGVAYGSKGNYDRAIKDFDRALTLDPKWVALYVQRCIAYNDKGDYDRAIKDCDQAIRLHPNDVDAFSARALVYRQRGDYDRAIKDLDEAIALDPKNARAFVNRGIVYESKGDYDRAIKDLDEAIALDPKYAIAFYNRGNAFKGTGNLDRAIADYSEALHLDPKDARAFNNRGLAYKEKKEYRLAIADYSEAIKLNPNYARAFNDRGTAYAANGDLDRAIADFHEAIKLNPKYSGAFNNRGNVYATNGDLDRAIADYDEAIALCTEKRSCLQQPRRRLRKRRPSCDRRL